MIGLTLFCTSYSTDYQHFYIRKECRQKHVIIDGRMDNGHYTVMMEQGSNVEMYYRFNPILY